MKIYKVLFTDGKEVKVQAESYTHEGSGSLHNYKFKGASDIVALIFTKDVRAILEDSSVVID